MPKRARYLITTADELTWKFDRPVLFLGEWCRLYDRRSVWEPMDGLVAAPFGIQPGQPEKDLAYVQTLSSQLLIELSAALNTFHNKSHSPRYWNILLGHWLQRYTEVCYNRYFTIEKALSTYNISSTATFDYANYSLATPDSASFVSVIKEDRWNQIFYTRILKFLGGVDPDSTSIRSKSVLPSNDEINTSPACKLNLKSLIIEVFIRLARLLSRGNDAFIVNTYLPKLQEINLQLMLGQFPQLWRSPLLQAVPVDEEMRRRFMLSGENHSGFERFVRHQLADIIPVCYLEGYAKLCQQADSVPWPAMPKFIFTSNSFDTDEVFKAWLGFKVECGVPYFAGQHGNNYGTYMGNLNWPELVSSDRFITWGWSNGNCKYIPSIIFKTAGQKKIKSKPNGGLVLVENGAPDPITTHDLYFKFSKYQEDQFCFVESLPEAIHEQLRVRLFLNKGDFRWSEKQRWHVRSPNTRLVADAPSDPTIWELYAQSRIVVFSFDSTGILETLSLNIPTVCFWHDGFDHLLSSAMPYYEMLMQVGIIVDGPEQAAKHIALHWDDMDRWWGSEAVQRARQLFCDEYAKTEKHPIRTLKRLLTKDL